MGYMDDSISLHSSTIRHNQCNILLSSDSRQLRCTTCATYRNTLVTKKRMLTKVYDIKDAGHINFITTRLSAGG